MPYRFGALLLLAGSVAAFAQEPAGESAASTPRDEPAAATLTEGFESERPTWRQEDAEGWAAIRLQAHDRTSRARHGGQRSEHFALASDGPDGSVFYSYPLPRIPLVADLEVSLYARASQPAVQLLAQVILPGDTDPATGRPSFVRVAGGSIDVPDRWQRLAMADLRTAVERQVRLLRFQTRRPIPTEGAYLDRIIVNIHTGGGETEVFLDDLRVSPVPATAILAATPELRTPLTPAPATAAASSNAPAPAASAKIQVEAGRLSRDGRDWFPVLLQAPGADLAQAMPFGFDVVAVPVDSDPEKLDAVVRQGGLLMPDLGAVSPDDREPPDPPTALEAMGRFPHPGSVAFWSLGSELGSPTMAEERTEAAERARALLEELRGQEAEGSTLTTATLTGDFPRYAMPGQNLDLLGVETMAWGTSREPSDVLEYLQQRRRLTALWNINVPFWAWVDASVPRTVRSAVWGGEVPPAWGGQRVQPEQVRLATYLALMAGYRGIAYRSDAELTRDAGRTLLYEMGLLNAEIDLVEPLLARGADPIQFLSTYPPDPTNLHLAGGSSTLSGLGKANTNIPKEYPPHPSIRAASLSTRDGRTRLVLIADVAPGAQWQPGQLAFNDLKVVVPGAPASAQAFEVRLGGGRWLERDRVPGGVRFTLPEFGVATMVVLTTDLSQGEQIARQIERIRPRAVDLAIRQAQQQLQVAADINARLHNIGIDSRDSKDLLRQANEYLKTAEEDFTRLEYEAAWDNARRATRPARLLMRAHFDQASYRLHEATASWRDREAGLPPRPKIQEGKPIPRDPYAAARRKLPPLQVQPIASPPLTAWQTLPQHYIWCDWVETGIFSRNLLESGNLDQMKPEDLSQNGWANASYTDPRTRTALRLIDAKLPGDQGRGQVLKLTVHPAAEGGIDRVGSFLDHPAAAVRTPPVAVKARQFLRISVLVKLPRGIPAGAGGLIVRDSLGGEALQYRFVAPLPDWSQVVLYRRVPADGMMTVTLGLAGFGEAFFDDVRIERLEQEGGTPVEPAGGDLAGRLPAPSPRSPRLPSPAPSNGARSAAGTTRSTVR